MAAADPFAPFAEKLARAKQPALLIEVFRRHYERLRAGETGKVSAAEIDAVAEVPDAATLARHRDAGLAALDGRRFETYWNAYSFGELTAAAEIRREVLDQLLPRLAIADRC